MNERLGNYRESFHLKLSLKTGLFPLKSSKNQFWPARCNARGALPWRLRTFFFKLIGTSKWSLLGNLATFLRLWTECLSIPPAFVHLWTWTWTASWFWLSLDLTTFFNLFLEEKITLASLWLWLFNNSILQGHDIVERKILSLETSTRITTSDGHSTSPTTRLIPISRLILSCFYPTYPMSTFYHVSIQLIISWPLNKP